MAAQHYFHHDSMATEPRIEEVHNGGDRGTGDPHPVCACCLHFQESDQNGIGSQVNVFHCQHPSHGPTQPVDPSVATGSTAVEILVNKARSLATANPRTRCKLCYQSDDCGRNACGTVGLCRQRLFDSGCSANLVVMMAQAAAYGMVTGNWTQRNEVAAQQEAFSQMVANQKFDPEADPVEPDTSD
ncbi:hypothetical protein BJ508DRAFT_313801 [Ascobolus immersus RN42]|uniref:Uncharacterized protein n=1 Tax=Ascobolus immersus RN42 TaxID=1160509 RepID=A0A3N4HKL6_ASCIM|nr:hypothetical protein BJ508DRAFT_313801 [Ascobolus immersus RN42]